MEVSCHRARSRLYWCVCMCRDHRSRAWRELPATDDQVRAVLDSRAVINRIRYCGRRARYGRQPPRAVISSAPSIA